MVLQQLEEKNFNLQKVAENLKKKFDSIYGKGWQCIVGNSFGCYITHIPNSFLYFTVEPFSVVLFRTENGNAIV
ncbi:unnamed protein product [Thelazia callipaeda]|uniref:Dynein light chain n=1 Tax=Thelazia callipaeda TaxID=103827 RepID=A0A3P7LC97_THECL|nr:unnamed protein product [Thelazia callipaeda]